jgi:hypothetical protein
MWYTVLTMRNPTEAVQFVILDGKGDWTTQSLLASPYMFVPPAGSRLDRVKDEHTGRDMSASDLEMLEALDAVYGEMERRFGVSSYKAISAADDERVRAWLRQWHEEITQPPLERTGP